MKTIVFEFWHQWHQNDFGKSDGGTDYGHRWFSFTLELIQRMKSLGYECLTADDMPLAKADIAVFWDVDEVKLERQAALHGSPPSIFVTTESPLYTPCSHQPEVMTADRWSSVLTWNRNITGPHVIHYDIPSNTIAQFPSFPEKNAPCGHQRAVVVKSAGIDLQKFGKVEEIVFIVDLALKGYVDVYGKYWDNDPLVNMFGTTPNKVETMARYDFAYISENSMIPGFMTEKIGDAILAGIPSIYYGDWELAEQKFPGCTVPLKTLTADAFLQAREHLYRHYSILMENVRRSYQHRHHWNDTFFHAFESAVRKLRK